MKIIQELLPLSVQGKSFSKRKPPLNKALLSYCHLQYRKMTIMPLNSSHSQRQRIASPEQVHSYCCSCDIEKRSSCKSCFPSQCKGWLPPLNRGLHSYCCSCDTEKRTCKSCFLSHWKGNHSQRLRWLFSPEQGTALLLLQLRYRKMKIMK